MKKRKLSEKKSDRLVWVDLEVGLKDEGITFRMVYNFGRGMKPTTRTRTRAQNPLPEFFEVAVEVQTTINSSIFEL